MVNHNYTSCNDPLCLMCEGYSDGYVDGKSKGLFEVSTRTADHPNGCGCDPCQAVVERLRRRADLQGTPDPRSSSEQESERDRSALPPGLQAELALILGIERGTFRKSVNRKGGVPSL